MPTPTYTLIASNTLGSNQATVTFSSIPSTYSDLVLRISARGDSATIACSTDLKFNADNTTVYSGTNIQISGASVISTASSNQGSPWAFSTGANGSTATSNTFGNTELYFPNYNSTGNKPFLMIGAPENNATTGYIQVRAGLYRGTSGITEIQITPDPTNFVSGSSFFLYGIKNA